jgi:hypothetical protein
MTGFLEKFVSALSTEEGWFDLSSLARKLNNPTNLEFKCQFNAVRGPQRADGSYWAKFPSPQAGITAAYRDALAKFALRLTLRDYVNMQAPAKDHNDVDAYVASMVKRVGIPDDATPLWNYLEISPLP